MGLEAQLAIAGLIGGAIGFAITVVFNVDSRLAAWNANRLTKKSQEQAERHHQANQALAKETLQVTKNAASKELMIKAARDVLEVCQTAWNKSMASPYKFAKFRVQLESCRMRAGNELPRELLMGFELIYTQVYWMSDREAERQFKEYPEIFERNLEISRKNIRKLIQRISINYGAFIRGEESWEGMYPSTQPLETIRSFHYKQQMNQKGQ